MDRTLEQRVADAIREEITIVPYDPAWPNAFVAEAHYLLANLPEAIVGRIEHFGSTAVPGLAAKPIIDMLIEVSELGKVTDQVVPVLESLGYEYFWRTDVEPPYAWFIKRDAHGQRTHHLHMVEADSIMWERLRFRDYLCRHPDEAARYAQLKIRLAADYPRDRVAYTNGKAAYIALVMQKAGASVEM